MFVIFLFGETKVFTANVVINGSKSLRLATTAYFGFLCSESRIGQELG
jgi:hypothetical protein